MFKKALSLLLALMLVVASFSVAVITVAAADGDAGSGSDLKVTATSNFFPPKEQSFTQEEINANNGKVTVTYFIQSEDRLVNADWTLTYDGTVLALNEEANQHMMPIATDAQVNFTPTSVQPGVKGNCTSLNTYFLCDENGDRTAFVTATFDVIGSGDTTVNLTVNEMRTTQLEDGKSTSDVESIRLPSSLPVRTFPKFLPRLPPRLLRKLPLRNPQKLPPRLRPKLLRRLRPRNRPKRLQMMSAS